MDVQIKMVMNNYTNLKNVLNVTDNSQVEIIKDHFNFSPRRNSYIQSFVTLIKMLEKSGELDAFNVQPFELIAEHLSEPAKSDLVKLIDLHRTLVRKCGNLDFPIYNQYAEELSNSATGCSKSNINNIIPKFVNKRKSRKYKKKVNEVGRNSTTNSSDDEVLNQNNKKQDPYFEYSEVIDYVSQEIGVKWKDMARYLRLKEEDIEDIEQSEKSLKDKARKSLRRFLVKEPSNPKDTIIEAVTKARRKDLVKQISLFC